MSPDQPQFIVLGADSELSPIAFGPYDLVRARQLAMLMTSTFGVTWRALVLRRPTDLELEPRADPGAGERPSPGYCQRCDSDSHRCPGCGAPVGHNRVACEGCDR